jgi:S-formylglutathione hydrolase FrmB
MKPWSTPLSGKLDEIEIDSAALKGNHLGDPHVRPLYVYRPPAYDAPAAAAQRFPVIYLIQGLTGQVDMWRNRSPFRPNVIELVDALFTRKDDPVPPCLVVMVDAWTSLGGSQYVDSPGTGNYMTYLCDDVVSLVDARYRTKAERGARALTGKSSGGYGAMVVPMMRPDVFGALATHAGDALFEICYARTFGDTVRALRDNYQSSFEKFWADFRSRPALSKPSDHTLLNDYCMAACYSADADGTVRMPFDVVTGKRIPEIWDRWLAVDPVYMAQQPKYADALRSMRGIYIDAGKRDEFFLDLGAEAFRQELKKIGVADARLFFELFDATHMAIEYRYPKAMEYLARKMAG